MRFVCRFACIFGCVFVRILGCFLRAFLHLFLRAFRVDFSSGNFHICLIFGIALGDFPGIFFCWPTLIWGALRSCLILSEFHCARLAFN